MEELFEVNFSIFIRISFPEEQIAAKQSIAEVSDIPTRLLLNSK